jgi:hypothetical protein
MRRLSLLIVALVAVSCGGSKGPTAPQGPQYPTVAGSYAGTVTVARPELGQSVVCPATMSVTQTNANVNISPIILAGACAGLSFPVGPVTIDQNGSFGSITGYTYTDPSCGNYTVTGSGGFFGPQFQFSISAVSATCWNMNITANLTR